MPLPCYSQGVAPSIIKSLIALKCHRASMRCSHLRALWQQNNTQVLQQQGRLPFPRPDAGPQAARHEVGRQCSCRPQQRHQHLASRNLHQPPASATASQGQAALTPRASTPVSISTAMLEISKLNHTATVSVPHGPSVTQNHFE